MTPATDRQRAKRGTIATTFLLKLDATLAAQVRAKARKAGVTVTEYIRQALRAWIRRPE